MHVMYILYTHTLILRTHMPTRPLLCLYLYGRRSRAIIKTSNTNLLSAKYATKPKMLIIYYYRDGLDCSFVPMPENSQTYLDSNTSHTVLPVGLDGDQRLDVVIGRRRRVVGCVVTSVFVSHYIRFWIFGLGLQRRQHVIIVDVHRGGAFGYQLKHDRIITISSLNNLHCILL